MPSSKIGRKRGSRGRAIHDANSHFDDLAKRFAAHQPPSMIRQYGEAEIWICSQSDITGAWLRSFYKAPLVITCKPKLLGRIQHLCHEAGCVNVLFNVGHPRTRDETFYAVLKDIKEAIEQQTSVILHCRAGRHRAPASYCLFSMYLNKSSFATCEADVMDVRQVDLQGWHDRCGGEWIKKWEREALRSVRYSLRVVMDFTRQNGGRSTSFTTRPPQHPAELGNYVPENPAELNPQDPADDDLFWEAPENSIEPIAPAVHPDAVAVQQSRGPDVIMIDLTGEPDLEPDEPVSECELSNSDETPRRTGRQLLVRCVKKKAKSKAKAKAKPLTLSRTQKRRKRALKANRQLHNEKANIRAFKRETRRLLRSNGVDEHDFPSDVKVGHVTHQPRKAHSSASTSPAEPQPAIGVGGTKKRVLACLAAAKRLAALLPD